MKLGEPILLNSRVISEHYSWRDDTTLRITEKIVSKIDEARSEEICQHFDCDLSDFKEWLEEKRRKRSENRPD